MTSFDQGGLNWTLAVDDKFTGPLQQFTQLVQQARQAVDSFRGTSAAFNQSVDQLRALADLTRAQTAATRQNRQQQTQAQRDEIRAQRELIAQVRERARVERERGAIIRQQRAEQAQAARAALGLDQALTRAAAQQQQLNTQTQRSATAARTATGQFQNLRAALGGAGAAGNRLVFTLRNIIGVGAGIAFIGQIQSGFAELLRTGIAFNAQVEDSAVGIAGLLTAVVDVRDAQGNLVTGAEAFNFALGIGKRQVDALRQATLSTNASFEELANTFQVALAPALNAGFQNLDQIRELAISVSQAASTIGVPTNQLSEEIRALLTGTIQGRTTRIATALGITPGDIADAKKEVGGLAAFLEERFRAFEVAGERAAGTFTGSFRRARVAVSLAAGDAARPLFEEIRTTFLEVFDTFTNRDPFGTLLPDPRVVQVLRQVFAGIADAVATIRTNLQQVSFNDILQSAQTLGGFFRGLGQALSGFIAGAINGFSTLGRIFTRVFGPNADLTDIATRLGEIITVVGTIGAAFAGVRVIISTLLLPITAIVGAVTTLGATMKLLGLTNPFVLLTVSAVALGFAIFDVINLMEDLNRIAKAATPEEQLSKAAQIRGRLIALQKEELRLIDQKSLQGISADEIGPELVDLRRRIEATKQLLALQQQADKVDPAAGAPRPTIEPPDFNETTFIEKIGQLASDMTRALAAAIAGEEPIEPPEIAPIKVDPIAEALAPFGGKDAPFEVAVDFKINSKEDLDEFGKALEKMADTFQTNLDLMRNAISEFSSFVADSIVDAFDPTNDTSFKERFARFLQSLARQIIATLTQLAIAKLLLGFGVGAVGGTTVGAGAGFAEGGEIEGPASPSHFGIRAPRPKGLDPTDTVPAWLAPGEFVHRASAVARYGADVMHALNQGLVDPSQLRSLAGLSASRSQEVRRIRRISGFADGGLISGQLAASTQAAAEAARIPQAAAAASGPTPAFIVGNDQAVDRFLRGGKNAFFEFSREHASTLRAIINTGQ